MKYPAIPFTYRCNYRVFALVVFWAAVFVFSANAQETLPLETEPDGVETGLAIEQNVAAVENPAHSDSLTLKPFSVKLRFHSPEFNFRLSNRDTLSTDELKRPFERFLFEKKFVTDDELPVPDMDDDDPPPKTPPEDRFHWRPAIKQSLMVLGIQHGYAVAVQEKTRRALANGNFFTDYWRSVKGLHGWDDGNRFFTNYVAHPMQGALSGFIFVQNHDRAKMQKFGDSKQYWKDRFKAFVWSTAWSTQWELGPVGQAAIGNLGLYKGMGYVDLVITPTVGTGWLVTEEAIDRYIIRHIEKQSFVVKMFARVLLNPMRSVANVLRFREPWYRDRPFGH